MATIRPRHMITETDEAASAIDAVIAANTDILTRADAMRFLLQEGIRAVDPMRLKLRNQRLKALAEMKNNSDFRDVWPENWKEEMLAEWPE